MWKKNLDKQFDGVEPCIICYSVCSTMIRSMQPLNLRYDTGDRAQWCSSATAVQDVPPAISFELPVQVVSPSTNCFSCLSFPVDCLRNQQCVTLVLPMANTSCMRAVVNVQLSSLPESLGLTRSQLYILFLRIPIRSSIVVRGSIHPSFRRVD